MKHASFLQAKTWGYLKHFWISIVFSNSSWHLNLYMFTDSLPQRFLLEIYMWCSWICTNAYFWTKRSLLFCLKPLDLRCTCDVLGPVQIFTCDHKKKLLLSCLKHPYLRFTCDVLGFVWFLRTSVLEIYMCRGWSSASTDVYLWAERIF